MRIQYRLTLGELVELNYASRHQRLKACIVAGVGVLSVLLGLWVEFFEKSDRRGLPVFVAGGGFLALGLLVPAIAGFGVWARGQAPRMDIELTPEGVFFHDPVGDGQIVAWSLLPPWKTTRLLIMMELTWEDGLAFPRRCFSAEAEQELITWMQPGATRNA
jgi:hypothetical protein